MLYIIFSCIHTHTHTHTHTYMYGFPGDTGCKESACQCWRHGLGRSTEEGMGTHANIFTGEVPWTEEPDGLQSIGLQRVRHC